MSGMYPDDRVVEIFGEQIMYPGLDKETHKFTDGDFFDPLIKPSHIPAETFNLILDNLGNFIKAMGLEPNNTDTEQLKKAIEAVKLATKNELFPVGSGYLQGINDSDPIGLGLPGTWQQWSARAEAYRLTTAAVPGWAAYTAEANYGAGAYVTYHLAGDDYGIWKSKAAITNTAAQLDPVLWEKYSTGTIVERRLVQDWLDNDLTLGATVPSGAYAGQKVTEIIVRGGKYLSYEGGNIPTFKTDGVQADAIRNFTGTVYIDNPAQVEAEGVFYNISNTSKVGSPANSGTDYNKTGFNPSRVVPTAADNRVRTLSERWWRRVA